MAAASHPQHSSDIWTAHYATERGFRFWPCEELVRSVSRNAVGGVAVEAGCGNGANLWFLAEHFTTVHGVDGCPTALKAAEALMVRRGASHAVRLHQGDIRTLPLPSGSAQLVVDTMTSQHLSWSDHAGVFDEYRRVLAPGGRLFLQHLAEPTSSQGAKFIKELTYDHLPELFPGISPVCLPTEGLMVRKLEQCRLRVVDSRLLMKTYPSGAIATYVVMEAQRV
jgi:cyclopropane fatty-acyl-phospholipid synthase-like methyltransferase